MVEDTTQQAEVRAPGVMPRQTPLAMCPMASMCKGMMENPPSGFLAVLPGTVLIVLGMLIFVEPKVLVWLMGAGFILFGVVLLKMGNFLRKLSVHARNM
jgi:hypothetical protein